MEFCCIIFIMALVCDEIHGKEINVSAIKFPICMGGMSSNNLNFHDEMLKFFPFLLSKNHFFPLPNHVRNI